MVINMRGATTHERRGDTLSEIAADEGTTVEELQRLNSDKIKDPFKIYAGDSIKTK